MVSSRLELGITSRLHQGTGWSGIGWSATGGSAPVVKLGITSSLDGGVMFDASLHADVIRRSHSGGSAVLPTFLDIAAGLCIIS